MGEIAFQNCRLSKALGIAAMVKVLGEDAVAKVFRFSPHISHNNCPTGEVEIHNLAEVWSGPLRKGWNKGLATFVYKIRNLAHRGKFATTIDSRLCLMLYDDQAGEKIGIIKGTPASIRAS